jgi:hypothetical protein
MSDGSAQKVLMADGHDRIMDAMKAFNEIMTGPNPLTKEEIRKLHQKRPDLHFLSKWC